MRSLEMAGKVAGPSSTRGSWSVSVTDNTDILWKENVELEVRDAATFAFTGTVEETCNTGYLDAELDGDFGHKDVVSLDHCVEYVDDLHSPKLRHCKSFKRMFKVPTSITRFFNGSRERERRYFNSGGQFALHTLLDTHAARTVAPHVKFDILFPKDICIVGDGYTHEPRVLDGPATFPAISKLRILVTSLPWIIPVQNSNGVTLRDIADAVCTFFRVRLSDSATYRPIYQGTNISTRFALKALPTASGV
ncbi:hypothetical protein OPQ81_000721 [Rhizoctonia solani]|nr:hypothetical protein OPQ81_000721 [Rhizoctonia solani]